MHLIRFARPDRPAIGVSCRRPLSVVASECEWACRHPALVGRGGVRFRGMADPEHGTAWARESNHMLILRRSGSAGHCHCVGVVTVALAS